MKILVVGHRGQVGWELMRSLAPLGIVAGCDRAEVDIAAPDQLRALLDVHAADVVVNAAAYTAVDQAETDEATAHAINATAPGIMAEHCRDRGALFVHYSTEYVFAGAGDLPHVEETATAPLNAYGRTKLAGEHAVAAAGGAHLLFRTSWVYGVRGQNFMRTILRLAREKESLRVVADQIGAPTWSRAIAETTALALARIGALPGAQWADKAAALSGTYHLTGGGETSWHGFACAIVEEALRHPDLASNMKLRPEAIEPIPTSAYPLPAQRPANSRMSNAKLARVFGLALPDWRVSLTQCLEDMH